MARDDVFEPPASGLLVPGHEPPEQDYLPWHLALQNTLKSFWG